MPATLYEVVLVSPDGEERPVYYSRRASTRRLGEIVQAGRTRFERICGAGDFIYNTKLRRIDCPNGWTLRFSGWTQREAETRRRAGLDRPA